MSQKVSSSTQTDASALETSAEATNSISVILLSAPVEENGDNGVKQAHPSTLPSPSHLSLARLSVSCCAGSGARSAPPTGCRVNIAWDRDSEPRVAEHVSCEEVNSQDPL